MIEDESPAIETNAPARGRTQLRKRGITLTDIEKLQRI
jgi:hypothetical protein